MGPREKWKAGLPVSTYKAWCCKYPTVVQYVNNYRSPNVNPALCVSEIQFLTYHQTMFWVASSDLILCGMKIRVSRGVGGSPAFKAFARRTSAVK